MAEANHFALRFENSPARGALEAVLGELRAWGNISPRSNGVLVEQDPILPLARAVVTGGTTVLGIHRLDGEAMAEQATTHLRVPTMGFAPGAADTMVPMVFSLKRDMDSTLFPDSVFSGQRYSLLPPAGKLLPDELRHLTLRADPGLPRLGLALADQLDEVSFFWIGEQAGSLDAGAALADALDRLLRGLEPGTDPVDVALIVASSLPCRFQFKQFELPYQWELPLLSSKQEFHFDGRAIQRQQVAVNLPEGKTVSGAFLEIDRGLDQTTTQNPSTGAKTGLHLRADRWTGTRLEAARDGRVVGVTLVLDLRETVTLSVELRADVSGQPTGALFAEAVIELDHKSRTHNIPFGKTVILNGQTCWLLLRPAKGEGVWEAEPVTGLSGSFMGEDGPTVRQEVDRHVDHKGLFTFIQPLTQGESSLEVYLDNEKLTPLPAESGRDHYPLDEALDRAASHEAPLYLQSGAKGRVTIYPTTYLVIPGGS